MAKKIQVISTYGDELTGELVKKCVAELEVRRLLADWVVKGKSIRRRKIREVNVLALPAIRETIAPLYIPEHLPPVEHGLRFIPPQRERNPKIAAVRVHSVVTAAATWDWSHDALPA